LSDSHWASFHRRWAHYTPPLRPDADVAAAVRQAIAGHDAQVLLLGVTPEFADAGADVTALDSSELMIGSVWPGDSPHRRAIKGDWLAMSFAAGSFTAAIGDGCLSALAYPDGHRRLYEELERVLRPGGYVVLRLFKMPDRPETVATVLAAARAGEIQKFHAFKWRLAMAMAAASADPNLAVQAILSRFEQEFPDRQNLAALTGWPIEQIDTIDTYRGSQEAYSFATFEQLCRAVPAGFTKPRLVAAGSYELAERCPLLITECAS
jgi:SAM-dependent methyltransferase